jgi:hypothetical protein
MTDRESVEIDYCPQCRGVWLDKGKLDKIIERSALRDAKRMEYNDDDEHKKRRSWRDILDFD